VWIGRQLSAIEARAALAAGVTAVLDLTAEFSESAPFLESRYLGIPVLDLTAPTQRQLRRAVEFIAAESQRGVVYVHCKIGYSRSAAAVGAYLLRTGQAASVAEAIAQLRKVRPPIVIRPEAHVALSQFLENSTLNSGGAQTSVEAATTA
jgi:protein-tyrosine phosphatase